MTKLRTCGWFPFVPAQSRKGSSWEKLSLPAMVCIVSLFCAAAVIDSPAQTLSFKSLATFDGTDGDSPIAGLVQATDGNFYGTTISGGANSNNYSCPVGCGTVFKITPAGTLTTLYSFCAQADCADGNYPYAGLVQARDGNFYGTTMWGGITSQNCPVGCGTVFKITPAGVLTTLYSFCAQTGCPDGNSPSAGLVQATDGNFYGTAYNGGGPSGDGTVFKITPSGTLTTLHSFDGPDGGEPTAALVQASDGNFYGTTAYGGASNCTYGCGTVFKITPGGTLTTLYTFCTQPGCTDGSVPIAALVQASDGNFYGTTAYGGAGNCTYGCGTVFKITPAGTLATLHNFNGYPTDGEYPSSALVQASDGNFYGTAAYGGAGRCLGTGCGTIFKITAAGTLTTLHSFDGSDGEYPEAGLVQATNGNFYGTTFEGGGARSICHRTGCGTVFSLGVVRTCATCRP